MKILTRNTAGLNQIYKLHQVLRQARKNDIIFCQEVKLKTEQLSMVRSKWGSNGVFLSSSGASRRGALTLLHARLDAHILHEVKDNNGQFHILVARIRSEIYMLVNVYGAPDTDGEAEIVMTELSRNIEQVTHTHIVQHIIMAGDFNFVLQDTDTTSHTRRPRAEAMCTTIINTYDLYDVAALQSNAPQHTYFRHRMERTSARYDRIYCTTGLLAGGTIKILPRTGDHAPVQFSTCIMNTPKDWRFSDNLLGDPLFTEGLHNTIRETLNQFTDVRDIPLRQLQKEIDLDHHGSNDIFSLVVKKIREYCMSEQRKRVQEWKDKEKATIDELIQARNDFNEASPPTQTEIDNLEAAQQKLMLTQSKRAQAASERNHVNYAALGERVSRYAFMRTGRGKASREITKLIIPNEQGDEVLQGPEIAQHMFNKYARIAQVDPEAGTTTIREFLGDGLINSLRRCPEEDHNLLTARITPHEISTVVKDFKTSSAPGPLGLTNCLIREIVPFMSEILADLGNKLFFAEVMPPVDTFLFHRMVIFILKPGKNATDPDSFRGLSLLEGFFKIFSKILANRMQRPMRHIQHPQQFGFTKHKGIMEASRTVLDTVRHAKDNQKALIVISTDFRKAFDSVSHDHIEACLSVFQFPDEFRTAFMRMVRSGTMQFQVNSSTSEDIQLLNGTAQGDNKSSFAFNLSAAPLNHYLAESEDVPRYNINETTQTSPVFFADDDLLSLDGEQIEAIINMLTKIMEYKKVSGLSLNLRKCEIMAINCNEQDVQRLIDATQMKRVHAIKHLGLVIDEDGNLPHEHNIAPVQNAMLRVADSLDTVTATPLGRSIYAKFLLASRYIHKIQNFTFTDDQLTRLRDSVLKATWTRHRIGTDTQSRRTHIANRRVSQPLAFGGLALPHPQTQTQAMKFAWIRKFNTANRSLTWVKLLEIQLSTTRRPPLKTHLTLGSQEWKATSLALEQKAPFWAKVFDAGATFIELSHRFDKYWTLIPITGYEEIDQRIPNIASLVYKNPPVKALTDAGLINVGQLFQTNQLGLVDINSIKTFPQIEQEFGINIPRILMNSLMDMVNLVRRRFRTQPSYPPINLTTILSLTSTKKKGCFEATRLLLRQKRSTWKWGEQIRSYSTYRNDNLINISSMEFSRSFLRTRRSTLPPSIQWSNLQTLLRTLWTNVKEQRSRRRLQNQNLPNPLCSNCHLSPEHTVHLLYQCRVAQDVWTRINRILNECFRTHRDDFAPFQLNMDNILHNYPPQHLKSAERTDLCDIIMLTKHILYRLKFRDDIDNRPSVRRVLVILSVELNKANSVRNFMNKNSAVFSGIIEMVKNEAGF